MEQRPQGIMAKMSAAVVTESNYTPITCVMYYDQLNPFEVVFTSNEGTEHGETIEWRYARDLIGETLTSEEKTLHGEGDVILSWENNFLFTLLQGDGNRAVVAFIKDDMETFYNLTTDLVPAGSEVMKEDDIDAALRELLGE